MTLLQDAEAETAPLLPLAPSEPRKLAPHLTTPMQRQALLEQVHAVWDVASLEAMAAIDRADIQIAYDKVVASLSA